MARDRAEPSRGRLVYSTDGGRQCPGCRRSEAECVCKDRARPRSGSEFVLVSRETKGRKGAGVTTISGLPPSDQDLGKLAKRLKARCGVGGTVKAGVIELQGDQRDSVIKVLDAEGYKSKRSGG